MTRFILACTLSKHPAFNTGNTYNVVKKIQLLRLKNLVWKKTSKCNQEKSKGPGSGKILHCQYQYCHNSLNKIHSSSHKIIVSIKVISKYFGNTFSWVKGAAGAILAHRIHRAALRVFRRFFITETK